LQSIIMAKKVYYLKTCDTSRRIIKELGSLLDGFEYQEIKSEPITARQLEKMRNLAGSYEALFSRRAKKYHAMGLKNQALTEDDYKYYLLNDYTFLKRPVIMVDNDIFVGSGNKNLSQLKETLQKKIAPNDQ